MRDFSSRFRVCKTATATAMMTNLIPRIPKQQQRGLLQVCLAAPEISGRRASSGNPSPPPTPPLFSKNEFSTRLSTNFDGGGCEGGLVVERQLSPPFLSAPMQAFYIFAHRSKMFHLLNLIFLLRMLFYDGALWWCEQKFSMVFCYFKTGYYMMEPFDCR